jgi:hypothetical protein
MAFSVIGTLVGRIVNPPLLRDLLTLAIIPSGYYFKRVKARGVTICNDI